jgi:hypothetical protein
MKAVKQEKTNRDETKACIMSIFQKFAASNDGKVQISNVTVNEKPVPTSTALTGILKRVKNTKTCT